jgi:hypothetical protein
MRGEARECAPVFTRALIPASFAILAYLAWIRFVDDPVWGDVTAIAFWFFVALMILLPLGHSIRRRFANRNSRTS